MSDRPAGSRQTILIIESPGEERQIIGDFLHHLGYDVDFADKGQEGVARFTKTAPDLVLVEILLSGGMNGLDVCKMIKNAEPWAKVVVLSKLYQSRGMRQDATNRWKADGYLEKPFELQDLRDVVYGIVGKPEAGTRALPENSALQPEFRTTPSGTSPAAPPPTPKVDPAPAAVESREESPPVDETPAEPAPAPASDSAIEPEGVFDPRGLAQLIRLIAEGGQTGSLTVKSGEAAKGIYFVDGRPVHVRSTLRSEALGQMLVESGTITEETFTAALERMKATGRKLGGTLVEMNAITSAELTAFVVRQTASKILGVFAWEGGRYRWDAKTPDQMKVPRFPVDAVEVLFAAVDRYFTDEALASRFVEDAGRRLIAAGSPLEDQAARHMREDDRVLLGAFESVRPAADAVTRCGPSEASALRAFYRLLTAGLIGEADDAPASASLDLEEPDIGDDEPLRLADEEALDEAVALVSKLHPRLAGLDDHAVLECSPADPAKAITAAYRRFADLLSPEAMGPSVSADDRRKAEEVLARIELAYENIKTERRQQRAEAEGDDAADDGRRGMAESELLYRDGCAMLVERRHEKAIQNFARACELNPNEADYHAMHGWAIYRMLKEAPHTVDEAIGIVKKALVLNAGSELAHLSMARIHAGENNPDAAVKFYRKTLSIQPDNQEAREELRELEKEVRKSESGEKQTSVLSKKLW